DRPRRGGADVAHGWWGPPRRGDGPGETLSAVFEERAYDAVAGDDEGGAVADFDEFEVEAPRQQRAPPAEDDWGRVGDDLVEEAFVGELAGEVAPAHHPQIVIAGGCAHLDVVVGDRSLCEADSRLASALSRLGQRQAAVGHDPRGHRVRPRSVEIAQHPLIRRRTHDDGTDTFEET